jgi:hypothetical protein
MAKKIQIDIEVNGKMQKATVSAKKLNAALDQTSKSARETDRNVKGTAQASSNASKNFSKMSQGMGGLVGAYASLAASLFAVSAAFNFLKGAGELKSLQAGQVAYASATGIALKSLTTDIVNATNAQITFKDAAQAAAIGTAAGLSADQLTRLGKAAADTSQILGRDVTDSFNRLVRGVTKAEPELLDELGIILRLERATTDYGLAIGKTADELTPFERSQAVANDVLTQAEEKYSKILDVVGRSPNQYAQLGKAFDDLVMKIQGVVDIVAGPLAKVLQDTPGLAIASFLLLLRGPLAAMGVSFQDIAKNARESANEQIKALKDVTDRAKIARLNVGKLKQEFQGAAGKAYALNPNSKVLQRASEGTMTKTDRANLRKALASAEAQYAKHGKIVNGIFKGMSIQMVTDVAGAFTQMELAEKNKVANSKVAATQIELYYAKAATGIKVFGAAIASLGVKLLNVAGWIGILITGYQLVKALFDDDKPEQKQITLLDVQREKIQKLNEELMHFVDIQRIMAEGTTSVKGFGAVAGVLDNLDTNTMTQAISEFQNFQKIQEKNLEIQKEIDRINEKNAATRDLDLLYTQAARTGRTEILPAGRASESLEEVPKLLDVPESAKASSELLLKVRDSIAAIEKETGQTLGPFETLKNMLSDPQSFSPKEILSAVVAAQDLGKTIRELPRLTTDAAAALKGFANSIAPKSQAQQTIDAIQKQLTSMQKVKDAGGIIDEKEFARLSQTQQDIAVFRDRAHASAMRQLATQKKITNEVIGELAGTRALREADNALIENKDKQLDIEEKIKAIETTKRALAGELTQEDINQLEILGAQLGIEKQLQTILEARRAMAEGMEPILNAQERLNILREIKGAEQQITNLAQKRLDLIRQEMDQRARRQTLEDEAAERNRNDSVLGRMFGGIGAEQRALEAQIAREEQLLADRKANIDQEIAMKTAAIDMEYDLLALQFQLMELRFRAIAQEQGANAQENPEAARLAADATSMADKLADQTGEGGMLESLREQAKSGIAEQIRLELDEAANNVDNLKNKLKELEPMGQILAGIGDIITSNINSALDQLVDGTISAKEAFKQMAISILKDIVKMINKLIVQYILMQLMNMILPGSGTAISASGNIMGQGSSGPGGDFTGKANFSPGAFDFGGGRYGGIMKPPAGYRAGGIADGSSSGYPVMLHGREAVVPLPHGDKIPVELRGGGTQQNNVGVTVNINNDGSSSTTTSADSQENQANALGNTIASVVRRELLNQKRAGGLLSPYGVQ